MKRILPVVVLCAVLVAGCSIILPADREMIHQNTLNAHAVNVKVQAVVAPTPEEWAACKVWWAAEDQTWVAMDAWAKGETPPVTP